MTSTTNLQELARANVADCLSNSSQYRIAILRHSSTRATACGADFEWIESEGDAQINSIRKSYLCQQPSTTEVCFLHEGRILQDSDGVVKNLDLVGEKLVVVEAILSKDILKRNDPEGSTTYTMRSSRAGMEPEDLAETENTSSASNSKDGSSADSLEREPEESEYSPEERIKRLQANMDKAPLESLEADAVNGHSNFLKLGAILKSFQHPRVDTSRWLPHITGLEGSYKRPRTLIGMLGPTGAGKSSLVNALLNEEGLLPTSSIRACTAAPSEIAYQQGESPYRAEVVYISEEEWRTELQGLLKDIKDGSEDGTDEDQNEDSETQAAFCKVKAVYPDFQGVAHNDVASLMVRVQHVLGTTKELEAEDAKTIRESLQDFISMPEQSMKQEYEPCSPKNMEVWPLVKVVRIYVKSEILKSGASLVDLPGVGDSNAARSAITQNYLKECDAFWIVAPIQRAADDKLAKSLLDQSFRTQLRMDCMFDATTFICTKADDVHEQELTKNLGLTSTLEPLWQEVEKGKAYRKGLSAALKALRRDLEKTVDKLDECYDKVDLCEEWGSRQNLETEPVPSKVASLKRRASSNASLALKRAKGKEEKSAALQRQKRDLRAKKDEISCRLSEKTEQLEKLDEVETDLKGRIAYCVVQARNSYCEGVIREEFEAERIQSAYAETEVSGNKSTSHRLPVFCVSSLASQKLQGWFPRTEEISGFEDLEDTNIPALRRHCLKLTITARRASCGRFLAKLYSFLTSLALWVRSLEALPRDVAACLRRGMTELQPCSDRLSICLQEAIRCKAEDLREEIEQQISSKFPKAVKSAVSSAKATSNRWGSTHRVQTYKAICRRQGVFRQIDWNQELLRPLLSRISPGWQKIFGVVIPRHLDQLATQVGEALSHFHDEIRNSMQPIPDLLKIDVLDGQIRIYDRISRDVFESKTVSVGKTHKEINRGFVPEIICVMRQTYDLCADEGGRGCFMRMKAEMSRKVDDLKDEVFGASCATAEKQLKLLIDTTENEMMAEIEEQLNLLRRDYLTALGGLNAELDDATLEAHRELAARVLVVLATIGHPEAE